MGVHSYDFPEGPQSKWVVHSRGGPPSFSQFTVQHFFFVNVGMMTMNFYLFYLHVDSSSLYLKCREFIKLSLNDAWSFHSSYLTPLLSIMRRTYWWNIVFTQMEVVSTLLFQYPINYFDICFITRTEGAHCYHASFLSQLSKNDCF